MTRLGRADLPWLALLVLPVALVFRAPLFQGQVLFRRDISMLVVPQIESFVRAVAGGALPLWDPYRAFGMPLLADPRAGVAYPLTWLNLVLRPATFILLNLASHTLLLGVGTYRWARHLGASRAAALLAGAAAESSGPVLSAANLLGSYAALAWLPWIAVAADECLDIPGRAPVLRLAAFYGVQVLAGSPEVNILTALALALLLGPRLLEDRDARLRVRAVRLLAAATLCAGLSAVQWMPTAALVRSSTRSHMTADARAIWRLTTGRLAEVPLPVWWSALPLRPALQASILEDREPLMLSVYLGAPLLALAAIGAWRGHRSVTRPLVLLAVVSLLYSMGPGTGAYELLLLTPMRAIRYPSKGLVLTAFAVSLLAALGVDRLRPRRGPAIALAAALAACVASIALVLDTSLWAPRILSNPGVAAAVARPQAIALGTTALLLALALAALRWAPAPVAIGLLVAASAGDLAWRHRELHPSAPPQLFAYRPPVLSTLPPRDHERVYVYDYSVPSPRSGGADPGLYLLARVPAGWAYAPALQLAVFDYLNPPSAARWGVSGSWDPDIVGFYSPAQARLTSLVREVEDQPAHLRLLQLGAVDHVLALRPAPWQDALQPVAEVPALFREPIRVYAVPSPRPRIAMVGGARVQDDDAALATILDPAFDPAREVVLAGGKARPAADDFHASARVVEWRADRVIVDASASAPGYLVDTDAFDPGWHATVDDQAAPVLRANLMFRAVPVPAGSHRVELRYRPWQATAGAAVSLASLALCAALTGRRARAHGM